MLFIEGRGEGWDMDLAVAGLTAWLRLQWRGGGLIEPSLALFRFFMEHCEIVSDNAIGI